MTEGASDQVTLRPAQESDRTWLESAMAALQDHESELVVGLKPGSEIAAAEIERGFLAVAQRDGLLLIAEQDGTSIGYIFALPKDEQDPLSEDRVNLHVYISDLFVAEGHRGQGIGRALLAEVERHFTALGHKRFHIGALAPNRGAWRLYESLGFTAREIVYEKEV